MPPTDPRSAALEDLARAGGRNAEVEIVEYDPAWPAAYVAERERLAPLLPAGVQLHHFGSTAVPGLAAKPVIDMIALVDDLDAPIAAMRLFTPAGQTRARRFYEREGWTAAGEPFHDTGVGLEIVEYTRPLR